MIQLERVYEKTNQKASAISITTLNTTITQLVANQIAPNLQVAKDKVEYLYKQKKMSMEPQKLKSANQITIFLEKIILG